MTTNAAKKINVKNLLAKAKRRAAGAEVLIGRKNAADKLVWFQQAGFLLDRMRANLETLGHLHLRYAKMKNAKGKNNAKRLMMSMLNDQIKATRGTHGRLARRMKNGDRRSPSPQPRGPTTPNNTNRATTSPIRGHARRMP